MFQLNDDLSIYATRGDVVFFSVTADVDGAKYVFQAGDVVRFKVYGKKNAESVVLQKDFPVSDATESVSIYLSETDTKIGNVISKPTDYWYEIELNPFDNPQTIIGYDEDGAKVFKLFPEGGDIEEYEPTPEDIPFVDDTLDLTSTRPVQNQAVARAVVRLEAKTDDNAAQLSELADALAVEKARITNLATLSEGSTTGDAELIDGRTDHTGKTWDNIGEHIRGALGEFAKLTDYNNDLSFPNKVFNSDGIVVESIENTSLMHFKANGLTLSSQKVFNVLADEPFYLKPNTTYTITTSQESGVNSSGGAHNLKLCRRDTYEEIALLQNVLTAKKSATFTTPANCDEYYFVCTFAASTSPYVFDITINVNISEGNVPNYKQYSIDINKKLPLIEEINNNMRVSYDILVSKDGKGDYTSLTEAVKNANDFDVIFVKNGVYENEAVKAWFKTVLIIGESRDGVVIKNNTGAYATPPIEMGTGLLKNLTVYAENDGSLATEPTNKGYAIHSESSVKDYGLFVIENCTVKSDWRSAWGMGMRGDTRYLIRGSEFEGVYFHDSEHSNAAGKQTIFFDNCNIVNKSLILQDQNMAGSSIDVRFNRCLVEKEIVYYLWDSANSKTITKKGIKDFPNWTLNHLSWGNSKGELNSI